MKLFETCDQQVQQQLALDGVGEARGLLLLLLLLLPPPPPPPPLLLLLLLLLLPPPPPPPLLLLLLLLQLVCQKELSFSQLQQQRITL